MKGNLLFWLFGGLLCLLPLVCPAQVKIREKGQLWPDLQADYNLDNNSFFFFRNEYRYHTGPGYDGLTEEGIMQQINRIQVQLGYEHAISDHWSGGGSGRYAFESGADIFFTESFLRHTGEIAGLRLMKRFSLEHLSNQGEANSGRARLLVELERLLELPNEKVFRPRLSYEVFREFAFTGGTDQGNGGRNIDRTRLRLDLSFEVNRHIFILPYFTHQTDYFVLEPQFDARGNVTQPGGKHNFITPIWGLGLRYNMYQSASAVSSRHR